MAAVYDFDRVIDRKGTSSLKFDFGRERKGREDLLPLWVADMDFALPEEILSVLKKRIDHGIFGYTDPKEDYYRALTGWFSEHHGITLRSEWNTVTPGVVYAIAVAINAFTKEGDAVIIQQPVYYPFSELITDNKRKLVNSALINENGRYRMDYDDFERKIVENDVKLFLLCNPHNPVGRVWSEEELAKIGEICLRHNVLVFSDEIHCDFTYEGYRFHPFLSVDERFAQIAVMGTSASKSFNLAGLQVANIFIPNPELREKYRKQNAAAGYSQANTLGLLATQTVYETGGQWHEQLRAYLQGNLNFVRDYLKKNLPEIRLIEPEGTYLVWLDFSEISTSYRELKRIVEDDAKLWLDPGIIFGKESATFERINIAAPRSVLAQALTQLAEAVKHSLQTASDNEGSFSKFLSQNEGKVLK